VVRSSSFSFECQQCGTCCRGHANGIPLFITDIQRLSRHLGYSVEQFLVKFCSFRLLQNREGRLPMLFLRPQQDQCPFLRQNRCLVHSHKPYLCRKAPVVSVLFENANLMRTFKEKCPGFNQGKVISAEEIQGGLQQEWEMEIADKQAYQRGWYEKLVHRFGMEVQNDPTAKTRRPQRQAH
jgi:Fe-S-cluster containining protein